MQLTITSDGTRYIAEINEGETRYYGYGATIAEAIDSTSVAINRMIQRAMEIDMGQAERMLKWLNGEDMRGKLTVSENAAFTAILEFPTGKVYGYGPTREEAVAAVQHNAKVQQPVRPEDR